MCTKEIQREKKSKKKNESMYEMRTKISFLLSFVRMCVLYRFKNSQMIELIEDPAEVDSVLSNDVDDDVDVELRDAFVVVLLWLVHIFDATNCITRKEQKKHFIYERRIDSTVETPFYLLFVELFDMSLNLRLMLDPHHRLAVF